MVVGLEGGSLSRLDRRARSDKGVGDDEQALRGLPQCCCKTEQPLPSPRAIENACRLDTKPSNGTHLLNYFHFTRKIQAVQNSYYGCKTPTVCWCAMLNVA